MTTDHPLVAIGVASLLLIALAIGLVTRARAWKGWK